MKYVIKRSAAALLCLCICSAAMAGVVANKKGKCGWENENGTLVVDYKYDFIGTFSDKGIAMVKNGNVYGFIDRTGAEIVPCAYDEIGRFSNGVAQIKQKKKVGLVSDEGVVLIEPKYAKIGNFNSDGIAVAVTKGTTSDIIDRQGNVIAAQVLYLMAKETIEGSTVVTPKQASLYSAPLDTSTKIIDYTMSTGKRYWVDLQGNILFSSDMSNPICKEVFGKKYKQSFTMSSCYDMVDLGTDDVALLRFVHANEKGTTNNTQIALVYYDVRKKQIITTYKYEKNFEKTNLFKPETIENNIKLMLSGNGYLGAPFSDGFACVTSSQDGVSKTMVINKQGETVAEYPAVLGSGYKDGYLIVKNEQGLCGLVDRLQHFTVPCIYDNLLRTDGGFFLACSKESSKWGCVTADHETVVPFEYDEIKATDYAILVRQNGKWGAYRAADFAKVLPCVCDDEPSVYGKAMVLANPEKGGVRVYNIEQDIYSDPFDGFWSSYKACAEHGNLFRMYNLASSTRGTQTIERWNMSETVQKGDTLWGYINSHAEIVLPAVFTNKQTAFNAYLYYRDLPVQEFSDVDIYRLPLWFSRRERTYELNAVIPESEWDY